MIAKSEVTESAVNLDNWSDKAHETMVRISSKVLVNGELRGSLSQEVIEVIHPADLSVIGHVPRCREADVDAAVNAAQQAFSSKSARARTWPNGAAGG